MDTTGSSDTQSFFGVSYATPFGFYNNGIPLWVYYLVGLFYVVTQMWMAWLSRYADKIEDEAMNIERATIKRFRKALLYTTLNTLSMLSTQFLILQISRPNVIFVACLYIGSILGNFFAMFLMEREEEEEKEEKSNNDIKEKLSVEEYKLIESVVLDILNKRKKY